MNTQRHVLGFGRTAGGQNLPIEVGDDGEIDGTGGTPETAAGPLSGKLYYGRASGQNVPLRVDASGKLNIDWTP